MKKISIVGLGYVGLPMALAIKGSEKYEVVGYDISKKQVDKINAKECPITDDLAEEELKKADLMATTDPKAMKGSDIYIICVPTPVLDDYTPDYTPVMEAGKVISGIMKKGSTVVLESTVNPGTCDEVLIPVLEEGSGMKSGKDFTVAMCPERINPGDKKWSVYNIPRNIGAFPEKNVTEVADFYRSFLDSEIHEVSSLKVAEATKIVENTFRDVNIAFVNELAKSFDAMGVDFIETMRGASNKPFAFLPHWPGRGVGGHCIGVDPYFLIRRAAMSGFNHRFLKIARDVNNSMPMYTVRRLQSALNEVGLPVKGTKVALLGLSFKENVADLRESPCLIVRKELERLGADLFVFDPYTPDENTVPSLDDALESADAVLLCTAHDEFLSIPDDLPKDTGVKVIVDGMNKLDREKVLKRGIVYKGIGR